MMAEAGDSTERRGLGNGAGAIIVALVYAIVGPLVGAALIIPIATIGAAQFSSGTLIESLNAVLSMLPLGFLLSYVFAGALALATGIAIATVAYRQGRVPLRMAVAAPAVGFGVFTVLHQFVHVEIPGTAILRGGGQGGMLLWLAVCIAASLICWLLTLPILRRSA